MAAIFLRKSIFTHLIVSCDLISEKSVEFQKGDSIASVRASVSFSPQTDASTCLEFELETRLFQYF